ncbi:hypothetical protein RMCC_2773 [Mycolicibacterium canariasense]|uniref:Secreted protein n=1 Tax=Mycolicibacterium canariasense TaxID=228230 RepID=A0A117IA47_MYCCR|nr:hypothetical protein [Mycolicibacterium canariasense]MCV7210371.1 hypothetical protein [Mycolicibacterium canariasense]ORU97128.1 hypothetical protein AWB94_30790 [Mycolicibacterium canariasense]GAS95807.1 hypothetical protein RMCC_2773 [Mycolicibacterium canariasense]
MIRELTVAATIACAALGTAAPAFADDDPGRYPSDVPGMNYDASSGAPCDNYQLFTFGRGPGGQAMMCRWVPNQWPPVYTGFWMPSYPLYGVQQTGAPCPGPQAAAQAPDGKPMLCLGAQGWQPGFFTGDGFFPA